MESKRKKIKAKFRNLTSKLKHNNDKNTCDEIDKNSTNSDLEDISAVDKIKQVSLRKLNVICFMISLQYFYITIFFIYI